jgi:hypothetical protein
MAKTEVHVTWYAGVEHGHAAVELESGTLLGWWTVEDGKGRGWGRIEPGTTGLTDEQAEAALDAALEEYWLG